MKIFFATDIHGSSVCFRKLLNVRRFYGAEVIVLGGDMTGKDVVLVVKQSNGLYTSDFQGSPITFGTKRSLDEYVQRLENRGLYSYVATASEIEELKANKDLAKRVFEDLIKKRLADWMDWADCKLGPNGTLYVCPGN